MADQEELTVDEATEVCLDVVERVEEAVVVERSVLFETLAAVIARGHVLVEDVPGTGKTVLARVLAESLGLGFTRVQFTPDLLPADVTGSNVYNEHEREFEFSRGPVFTNVVLADEINRAPPKTQAALLESMEERQVSVDGTTHDLPEPFVVIATQNPVEQEGTFRLPEAQRDRFAVKTSMGYPDVDGEMDLLDKRADRRSLAPSVDPVIGPGTVLALQDLAEDVRVDDKVRRYIIDIARETRADERTEIGVSPRGVQRVFEAVRAGAVVAGREYTTPDDVKRLARATMAHRLVLTTEATVEGVDPEGIISDALDAVDVPAVSPDAPDPGDPGGDSERVNGDGIESHDSSEPANGSGTSDTSSDGRGERRPSRDRSAPERSDGGSVGRDDDPV
ncbi:AAA family ATPase [Halosimplex aquaticum]|uniref:AAA family ATPase n=1 Tax=Halosimplex aquaticum TaxID=3026162 RepID=A0ABD5Y8C1_9EURY|nr:MoxR family ATPase [Halosimplex aquaticum]